jgi:hypothetical protein
MEHSQSSLPLASRPDVTVFAEGGRAHFPQHSTLPPEVIREIERLGIHIAYPNVHQGQFACCVRYLSLPPHQAPGPAYHQANPQNAAPDGGARCRAGPSA